MNPSIIIAACVVIGLLGIAVAAWSIHRTHRAIYTRNRSIDSLDVATTQPDAQIVDRIEVLRPKAGDMLLVEIDRPLTVQQRDFIRQMVSPHVPDGVKLVVLDVHVSVKHVMAPTL